MNPKIINVKEARALTPNGQLQKILIVTYNVGTLGPFTLQTNETELNNKTAQQKMQAFANTLSGLPGVTAA